MKKIFRTALLLLILSAGLYAQTSSVFQSQLFSRSLNAAGMGEQGVASRNVWNAMQYNPALLVHSNRFNFSFFNNPWNIYGWQIPLIAVHSSWKLENGSAVGVEYTYWNFGDIQYSTAEGPLGDEKTMHVYERSVSAAYAMPLDEHLAAGVQARYAWLPVYDGKFLQHLLFSAGISAQPEIFDDRMTIGFSLINFSTAVEFDYTQRELNGNVVNKTAYDSPPSQLNLGIDGKAIANEFFDIHLSLGMMKPIVKRDDGPEYNGQSSFSALVNSWGDFPNDATGQIGLSTVWHPIDLGHGVSFFQEMNLGYFTAGPKGGLTSFMTHGVTMGVQANGLILSAGYAGRWHNYRSDSFLPWNFPWETVQFTISGNTDFWGRQIEEPSAGSVMDKIIISGGYTFGESVGKMKKTSFAGVDISFEINNVFSVESDFYFTENSALHTAFRYAKATQSLEIDPVLFGSPLMFIIPPHVGVEIETMSLESGYRYHPFDQFHPLFFQGSLGIIRMNPVIPTTPRYSYQTYDEIAAGLVLPILESGFVLIPKAGWKTFFIKEIANNKRLGGYNQFTFGINAGYAL